ncbi:DUF3408 domain-containing protein [Alistipes putredinis]|uniref:DUF3408 domain-containing protein n=1 Tax=Alistipes putredinis TaxID=28117 RepID=UPI0036F30CF7
MASRKADTAGIDEALLLEAIGRRKQDGSIKPLGQTAQPPAAPPQEEPQTETAVPPEIPRESPARRRKQNADYGSTYLRRNEIKTRQCVYISRDVHNKISKIVNIIADKEITVGGYIDTVLLRHLEQHKDEINELYRREREDLI